MVAYTVFFFLITLIVGGIGIDLMRFEMERTKLQNTLDRAVLAAADLDQESPPADVVRDYFNKADLSASLADPTVDEGLNYRIVSAEAQTAITTQFTHMLGIDTMYAPASSTAEERIEGVEISMVLDVSGSMHSNNRLTNLKPAARSFVDTVLALTDLDDISISLVPYNTQVSAGDDILRHLNVTDEHDYSHCVNFDAAHFNTTALSSTEELERTGHFDIFTYSSGNLSAPICSTRSALSIAPLSNDGDGLKRQINQLVAGGNTSIDVGMKWATALLDPSMRGTVTNMISDGTVNNVFAGRPTSYEDGETVKVIVVMTDGQNTTQYQLKDQYREGNSDVWYNSNSGRYSLYIGSRAGNNKYFWPNNNSWNDHPYGQGSSESGSAVRLTYPQLWHKISMASNARYNYTNAIGSSAAWNTWYYGTYDTQLNGGVKDSRLQSICQAAKDNGVVIYAIGFEATTHGENELRDCASSPSHFFDVDGLEIADAFSAIASSISQLRLTQ
ncbi:MAG: hypothetical protein CSA70_04570 [Rhodobacterales bacterium]|nr:MAG: hypothetical protein CSA70_04570 [Rhodobacterales bacterium]